jgi:hypothetical protein
MRFGQTSHRLRSQSARPGRPSDPAAVGAGRLPVRLQKPPLSTTTLASGENVPALRAESACSRRSGKCWSDRSARSGSPWLTQTGIRCRTGVSLPTRRCPAPRAEGASYRKSRSTTARSGRPLWNVVLRSGARRRRQDFHRAVWAPHVASGYGPADIVQLDGGRVVRLPTCSGLPAPPLVPGSAPRQ